MRDIKNVLILFNNTFYKETDIDSYECDELIISNDIESDIPLKIDVNMSFSLKLIKNNGYWEIQEGENIYLVINDIKVKSKKLVHGDQISIKLITNRLEIFKINFFIDFSSGKENYDKIAYFNDVSKITIGSDISNNICIEDNLVDKLHAYIKRESDNYTIVDNNSKYSVYINGKKINGSYKLSENDFIIICGYKFLFLNDSLLLNNYSNTISINGLKVSINKIAKSSLQYPEFIRNPRYMYNLPNEKVDIIAPPKKDKKPTYEMFLTIIPTIGMMTLMLTVRQGSNSIYYIGMVCVTILTTLIMFVIKSKKASKSIEDRNKKYMSYLRKQERDIKYLFNEQERISKILYPTVSESMEIVQSFNHRLWEKELNHDDFLSISLGKGVVPITFKVDIPKEEWGETEDELILKPREIKEKYKEINDMPIELNLANEKAVAIVGSRVYLNSYIKEIIVQIVSSHYYEDVKLALICDDNEKDNWDWMRWLPHVWSEDKKVRFLGAGKEAAHNIMSVLANYFEKLSEGRDKNNKEIKTKPYFILLVTNPSLLEKEKLSRYLEMDDTIGYTPIFLYEHFEKIPKNCSTLVKLKSISEGEVTHFKNAEQVIPFVYESTKVHDYEEFSRRIAPIYVKESYTDSSLPSSITFFDLYDVNTSREIPIFKNWNRNEVFKNIRAPLGVDTAGNLVNLDLHEKYHGPHGLVAGTTGSGKSEILQSLIASLAVNYHPYDINFILIDYKGGGMANLFKDLPHLVGTITNLDGRGINRSLIAIKSELKRRQRMFSEVDVNHIDKYIKLYKDGKVKDAIPHLIIIADEFAELKRDQPDFMQELVSTARIGRSLGVHLILATQKPSGVVNDQIWSNSKFKLCLKVQDANDSNEVIKSKLAANIVEPGRAYLQVGNNEIFELFQSAWSGAKVFDDDNIGKNEIEISKVSIEGIREVIYSSKDDRNDENAITQLDEVIKTVSNIAKRNCITRLQGPWLPELKKVISFEDIENEVFEKNEVKCNIGLIDDPESQKQYALEIDFMNKGNILIIGGAGYGKTTILQTMTVALAKKYTPKEVNLYILDFGTRVLKIFERLPHVGGVVLQDNEEKLIRLIKLIRKEIESRKDKFSKIGVASLGSYREATNETLPQIIILIDNFIALKETYEFIEEEINYILREGSTLGISVVVTTNSYGNIRYKMLTNFKETFVLTCGDKNEYTNVFSNNKVTPTDVKGRLLLKGESVLEAQICLPLNEINDNERGVKLKYLIEDIKSSTNDKAKAIPCMPDILSVKDMTNYDITTDVVPLGITYSDIEEEYLNLNKHPFMYVVGTEGSGKSNFLKNVISSINKLNSRIYVFDSKKLSLRFSKENNNVNYVSTRDNVEEEFKDIMNNLEERLAVYNENMLKENFNSDLVLSKFNRITIIIDNLKDFIEVTPKHVREDLNMILTKYRDLNINIIIATDDNTVKDNLYAEPFVKKMKEEQCGLAFMGIDVQKTFDVQLKYGRKKEVLTTGDGFFVNKGQFIFLKTPISI